MESVRKHGAPPYAVALVHGGPGAAGELELLAAQLEISSLEPMQSACSIEGQIQELHSQLKGHTPIILLGYSWGAWLSMLFAARYPDLVRKLILISCAPLEDRYAHKIHQTRMQRLDSEEQHEVKELLHDFRAHNNQADFTRLGTLLRRADAFCPLPHHDQIECRIDIYRKIWPEAADLRWNGQLIETLKKITCPVAAIHGAYDPHPYMGVKEPLARIKPQAKFHLLNQCGHKPWIEKHAPTSFKTASPASCPNLSLIDLK